MQIKGKQILTLIVLKVIIILFAYNAGHKKGFDNGYNNAISDIADCSLADAKLEKCFIPCTTDLDCVEKNGIEDH